MKVFIAASIGYGGADELRKLQNFLRSQGFEVLDQLELDYSDVEDFRDKPELCEKIVNHDLKLCDEADVIVFLATNPSFGAMGEVLIASMKGKPVITFAPSQLKSPWPVRFSKFVATTLDELVEALRKVEVFKIGVIPNVYGEHEATFSYDKFTCICPVTGLEDKAVIRIRYKPKKWLLEYESLDKYFKSFADKPMHHEAVVAKIYADIKRAVEPEELEVEAEFEERSGVKAIVRMREV